MGKSKKELRTGYTTGACAAAAAKAATEALVIQRVVDTVEITLPAGELARFQVRTCIFGASQARCSIIKDAGDDPDVTHGAEIRATVRWTESPGLTIDRGEGVGLATKPGLGLDIGAPAINPVPRRMITYSVEDVIGGELAVRGLEVTISVPGGTEMAKKTLNQRLGIVGGISILGTTGIVKPFSTSAYKACIIQALDVAIANGCTRVVLTTGGRTEKFAQRVLSLPQEAFIQMGDFVGFTLRRCAARGIREVVIAAMIGKLSKIAAGNFQTHVGHSRVDTDFLASVAASCGASPTLADEIRRANTARHFSEIVLQNGASQVLSSICQLASRNSHAHAQGKVAVECILAGFNGQILSRARADG